VRCGVAGAAVHAHQIFDAGDCFNHEVGDRPARCAS
jgi:hypothetical protein